MMKTIFETIAKKIFLSILMVSFSLLNMAATYYISNSGNDSNSGLTTALAWKTISKVNGFAFNTGDIVSFKGGDTWVSFSPRLSPSVGNITINSFGIGQAEFTAFQELPNWNVSTNWTEYSTGIWRMPLANVLNRLWINNIDSYRCQTLTLTTGSPWHWESGYLYLKSSSNPATFFTSLKSGSEQARTIEASGVSGITFQNIKVTSGNICIQIYDAPNTIVENCTIGDKVSYNGINVYSAASINNVIIRNNIFTTGDNLTYSYAKDPHTTGDAIQLGNGCTNCKVYGNYISSFSHAAVYMIALNSALPFSGNEVYSNYVTAPTIDYARAFGADTHSGSYNNSFHDNTAYNMSVGNQLNSNGLKFYNNIIDGIRAVPYTTNAGYGIAISGYASSATNMEIYNNTITNCINVGIVIDWFTGTSIEKSYNNIHDNNLFNNGTVTFHGVTDCQLWVTPNGSSINHNTFANNHFFCSTSSSTAYYGGAKLTASGFNSATPQYNDVISTNDNIIKYGNDTTAYADLRIEHNGTSTAKTVSLSQPMINTSGVKYSTTVTLLPFTSVVLLKDPTKYSTEYKSICEGSSYNSWTTTGKYLRTLQTKTGADSIVTTYLSVNPKYTITEDITIDEGLDYNSWTTSGQYSRSLSSVSGCDSTVVTNLTVVASTTKQGILYTQTIDLKKGYNMISTYVDASNSSVSTVTQPIRDNGMLIKMQDESGNSYENMGNLAGWVDNMGSILETEGYKIRVAADCSLQVTGTEIALPLDIPLNMGWNIVSFPRTDVLDGMNMIQSLIDQNILIKVQDEAGNSIENWGIYGGWKNSIGNFIPGKAYRVKVSASSVLTIQQSYPKSAILPVYFEQTSHFSSVAEGNGYEHMNINLVGLNGSGLVVGDELAAFDGITCVGTLKITQQQLIQGSASLIASCSTGNQVKDGFKEGASIQLYVWNQVSDSETPVQTSILSGSLNYLKNASLLVKMKSVTTSAFNLKDVAQVEVFPNPSQGLFTVRFSDLPANGSHIDIYDLSGRKVASHLIEGISEDFNLSDQAAGVYLVKSILGSQEKINKLVIQ